MGAGVIEPFGGGYLSRLRERLGAGSLVRVVHLGRSTCHAISGRGHLLSSQLVRWLDP